MYTTWILTGHLRSRNRKETSDIALQCIMTSESSEQSDYTQKVALKELYVIFTLKHPF